MKKVQPLPFRGEESNFGVHVEEEIEELSLDAKAHTLAYQLPSAESELFRLEELKRTLHNDVNKKRYNLPTTQVNLADWLQKHPDVTLKELNLADSRKPVQAINVDDALGVGRYQMRGDLKTWMEKVQEMNDEMRLDAGDWNSDDEREIDDLIAQNTKLVATKELQKKKKSITDHIVSISEILQTMSKMQFRIDTSVLDEEQQIALLHQYVDNWYTQHRKQEKPEEQQKVHKSVVDKGENNRNLETDEQIRKQQMQMGVVAGAQSIGMLLTPHQVEQVLRAFYEQEQPHISSEKKKSRLERQLAETLAREECKVHALRRSNHILNEKLRTTQEALEDRQRQLEAITSAVPSELRDSEHVAHVNAMTKAIAEVLSRKKIREANEQLNQLIQDNERLVALCEKDTERVKQLVSENQKMHQKVREVSELWELHLTQKAQKEEEQRILYGGKQDDKQHFINALTVVLGKTCSAMSQLQRIISEQHLQVAKSAHGNATSELMLEAMLSVGQWAVAMYPVAVTDSIRMTLVEMIRQCTLSGESNDKFLFATSHKDLTPRTRGTICAREWRHEQLASLRAHNNRSMSETSSVLEVLRSAPSDRLATAAASLLDPEKELVDGVARRLENSLSEARTKFREIRFMRATIRYLVTCFEAMSNGSYDDEIHGQRKPRQEGVTVDENEEAFPPKTVVAPDENYDYAWHEELKLLESVFVTLRNVLSNSEGERTDASNAVLRAIESVAVGQAGPAGRRQTTTAVKRRAQFKDIADESSSDESNPGEERVVKGLPPIDKLPEKVDHKTTTKTSVGSQQLLDIKQRMTVRESKDESSTAKLNILKERMARGTM